MENQGQQKFNTWWDEKNNIVRSEFFGDQEEKDAELFANKVHELANTHGGKVKILTDGRKGGKSSTTARKIYYDLYDSSVIEKSALFGLGFVQRIIASFIRHRKSQTIARFFETEEEALKWLKEE